MNESIFPQNINIHFVLDETMHEQILQINSRLVDFGSEINFSKNHIPHLTIVMGEIDSLKDFEKVKSAISSVVKKIEEFDMTLSFPYLAKPSEKFVFTDALPVNFLTNVKIRIYNEIKDYIKLNYHGGPDNKPHITLGYLERKKNLIEILHNLNWKVKVTSISEIGISPTAARGSCLSEYTKYKLTKARTELKDQ